MKNRIIVPRWKAILGVTTTSLLLSGLFHDMSAAVVSYQGVLQREEGRPSGSYDFVYSLHQEALGGAALAVGTNAMVPVRDGQFLLSLEAGQELFDGRALWLEFQVRPSGTGEGLTRLLPRQPLTSVPYALHARSVAPSALPGAFRFMEFVTVGDPQNAPDTRIMLTDGSTGYGAVATEFQIGKYEVTNTQYVEYLNSIAHINDRFAVFNNFMESDPRGGIKRRGSVGNYRYTVKKGYADKPVIYTSFWDALRFCNWMHHGRPVGEQNAQTTEDGAYTVNSLGITANSIVRNPGARYFLPSEDQWYKAAYYDPTYGESPGYWEYPTQSSSIPSLAFADTVGNVFNDNLNIANYDRSADWLGQDGNVVTVGSAGPGSRSFYGAYDMGGNVAEWNDTIITVFGQARGLRGTSWSYCEMGMRAEVRNEFIPGVELNDVGFRMARIMEAAGE